MLYLSNIFFLFRCFCWFKLRIINLHAFALVLIQSKSKSTTYKKKSKALWFDLKIIYLHLCFCNQNLFLHVNIIWSHKIIHPDFCTLEIWLFQGLIVSFKHIFDICTFLFQLYWVTMFPMGLWCRWTSHTWWRHSASILLNNLWFR